MAPDPDRGELVPMAAGERIVAFAGPGKRPTNLSRTTQTPLILCEPSTVFKACFGKDVAEAFWIQVYRKKLLYFNDCRVSCSQNRYPLWRNTRWSN
jgi:hypothetical protein